MLFSGYLFTPKSAKFLFHRTKKAFVLIKLQKCLNGCAKGLSALPGDRYGSDQIEWRKEGT